MEEVLKRLCKTANLFVMNSLFSMEAQRIHRSKLRHTSKQTEKELLKELYSARAAEGSIMKLTLKFYWPKDFNPNLEDLENYNTWY